MPNNAAPVRTPGSPGRVRTLSPGLLVALLVYVEISSGVIQGSISPVLPALGERLGVDAAGLNWVSICQLLSSAACVPVLAQLGDLYGHRKLLRITLCCVAVGTVLVALAPNYPVLLAGRVLEGLLAVWLPLEFAIVRDRLPQERTAPAIAKLTGGLVLGVSLGTLLAGVVSHLSPDPRVALAVPAVLTLSCLPIAWLWVPESDSRKRERADVLGAVLLTLGLGALLVGLSQGRRLGWTSGGFAALMLGAVVALGLWAVVELRREHPMVDLRFTVRRDVLPLYVAALVVGVALFGTQSALATFTAADPALGYGFGYATLGVALVTLPVGLSQFVGSHVFGGVVSRLGGRRVIAGAFALAAAGYVLLTVAHLEVWQVVVANVVAGVGVGAVIAGLPTVLVDATPKEKTGIATGVYQVSRNVGGSVAGAVFAAVLAAMPATGGGAPSEDAYQTVWLICAGLLAVGCWVIVMPARRRGMAAVQASA
ncbi:MFS transporter [Streptomyces sp. NPDC051453]|uniref:MFS transporter n=1 Tax=Streptomyces sp. NPDC051453 TaxID=3154941 RepID=UPI003419BCB7